jgi:hypothetical protein
LNENKNIKHVKMGENEMTMEMKPYEFIDEKVFVESFDGIEELVSRDGNSDNV